MNKAKKDYWRFKYDGVSGEINVSKLPQNEVELLIESGIACEIRTKDKTLYLANVYIFNQICPNNTLLKIFEKVSYCRKTICKKYSDSGNIHHDCNECKWRIPWTEEELVNPPFINSIDKFEMGEPPEFDNEDSDEYMSYKEYLQTDYWKNFRKAVLEFYGEKCNWCGISGEDVSFNIHHIRYGMRFDEKIENVIPLCFSCHQKAHGKG